MRRHSIDLTNRIKILRSQGKTYGEINSALNIKLAKSTLYCICKDVSLPKDYLARISQLNIQNLGLARATAAAVIQIKREEFASKILEANLPIARLIQNKDTAKIALAMLCLGEASKSTCSHTFSLGNSDHRIISLFLDLLQICFNNFDRQKIKATVQCRADQNIKELERYWREKSGIPKKQFYKTQVDPRTIGKPTQKPNYHGVLNVNYSDTKTQLELESLSDLVYNFAHQGPVVQR